jgi:hypothetical protein
MVFIILTITIVGIIAIILLAIRWIMKRRTTEDVEKTKARRHKELTLAAESLELIANDMDEWVKQQKDRIMHASVTFQKKWISRWFSDFFVMELFKDKVHKKHFGDIIDTFRLYMPDIAELLKKVWHNFLNSTKFMRQIQNVKHKAEDNHDLGYWCSNFLDKIAVPTAKSLRSLSEQTRKHLTAQKQAKEKEEQPKEVIDKQVVKLTAQKQAKKKEEQPKEVIDKQVGKPTAQKQAKKKEEQPKEVIDKQVVKLTSQKQMKKKEERSEEIIDKKVGKLTAQKQVKRKEERPKEVIDKQADKPTSQKQAKKKEKRPKEVIDKQADKPTSQKQAKKKEERPEEVIDKPAGKPTSQKQTKTEEDRPEGVLNKQVGILLESSPDTTASEIARMLNEDYAGVYKPISPSQVVKTQNWRKYIKKLSTVSGRT